jgi:hypothetical protein
MQEIEQLFTFKDISARWHISPGLTRKLFRARPGVLNMATPERPAYRVPASVVLEVLLERGYTREQAEAMLHRAAANAA